MTRYSEIRIVVDIPSTPNRDCTQHIVFSFLRASPTRRDGELNLATPNGGIYRCKREHYRLQTRGAHGGRIRSSKCNTFLLWINNVKFEGVQVSTTLCLVASKSSIPTVDTLTLVITVLNVRPLGRLTPDHVIVLPLTNCADYSTLRICTVNSKIPGIGTGNVTRFACYPFQKQYPKNQTG